MVSSTRLIHYYDFAVVALDYKQNNKCRGKKAHRAQVEQSQFNAKDSREMREKEMETKPKEKRKQRIGKNRIKTANYAQYHLI